MAYISTGMGNRFCALLVSLMALWLTLVEINPFWPCFCKCGSGSFPVGLNYVCFCVSFAVLGVLAGRPKGDLSNVYP